MNQLVHRLVVEDPTLLPMTPLSGQRRLPNGVEDEAVTMIGARPY